MADDVRVGRVGGGLLALGGVGFAVAGALHPRAPGARGFHGAMVTMLSSPLWPAAHWVALVTGVLVAWALWLLVDGGWVAGSVVGLAGARLAMLATLFMSVEWAVEIAARGGLGAYSAGAAVPMAALVDAMQGVGWPALGLGFALLAASVPAPVPRAVGILGAAGSLALGLAGLLAQGLHILPAGVLFLGGNLLALWMIWAGVETLRRWEAAPRGDGERERAVES